MKYYKLNDLCTDIVDCPHTTPDWKNEGIRVVRNFNLKDGNLDFTDGYFVDEATYLERPKRAIPEEGDIIISREAPMGVVGIVPKGLKCCLGQRLVLLKVNKGKCDPYYLLNTLMSDFVQTQFKRADATGSIVSNLCIPDLKEIIIPVIESGQEAVARLLEIINKKQLINNAINDNLHQQAATLFKALFVDLTPFDGTMPPNWTISTLGDATEMGAGGDKPKESSPVKTPLCPYPIYSNGINDYGLYGYTNDPKIKVESVTVSARGTIGYVCLRHTPYVPIVRLVTLIPDTKVLSAKYLYLYLRQLHITGTGTTQQQLTVPDFRKTEIIIPDKNTMDSFTETVTPLFEQIWANEDENTKLAEVRDALLPKLMSGEIDVSDIQL